MRCPLRVKAFDQPDTCDERCAWLVTEDGCHFHAKICAITVLAVRRSDGTLWPANFMREPKEVQP